MDRIHVLYPEKIGIISKNIYGYFIEQIGAMMEGGIWVGEDSGIPNIKGLRKELIEKLRAIKAPVFRWGGCTSEVYDWRTGIGPRETRPVTLGVCYRGNGKVQHNDFGTHEFIDFCRLTGADPYITLNVAGSAPLESYHWMEYCNMPRGATSLAKLREENGSPEPFNVRYWAVGNENNEHGGLMTPEDYCATYCRVVSISHPLLANVEMVASGPTWGDADASLRFFHDFNRRGLGWGGKRMEGYSLHCYTFADGNDDTFSPEQWYRSLAESNVVQKLIDDHLSILQEFDSQRRIGLFFDEWGHWTTLKSGRQHPSYLQQIGTMREALVAANTLNIFNNNCDIVKMANLTALINYIHSLFNSESEKLIVTPTYHVFDMMKEHQDAACIRTVCASEMRNGVQQVTASASVKAGVTLITLVNSRYDEPTEVTIELHNNRFPEDVVVEILAADDPHAHNTFDNPDAVTLARVVVGAVGHELRLTLPAASVVCVHFDSGAEGSIKLQDFARVLPYNIIRKRETNYTSPHNIWN